MNLSLNGKNALVCGASRGIGRAVACELAQLGSKVLMLARDARSLEETRALLAGNGHRILAVDMADTDALEAALAPMIDSQPVQILVNNSGGPAAGPAHAASAEAFALAFRQHLIAAQTIAALVIPAMRASGYGRIVNIISTSVKEPIAGLGVSNTIRGAVAGWAKTLATELGADGITVNNVLPGFTATERLGYLFADRAQKSGKPVEKIRDEALAQVPAARFAEPAEIAAAVGFLASPAASYINGINLPVDGGRTRSL